MVVWWVVSRSLGAVKLLNANEAERLQLKLYDFACEESALHKCACQLRCEDRRRCSKALEICGKYAPVCEYVLMNGSGEWATLKRSPNEKELKELNGYEEHGMDAARFSLEKKALEKEGNRWRGKYLAKFDGFADAFEKSNRTEALASILRGEDEALCGRTAGEARNWLRSKQRKDDLSVALVTLSYRTPGTLRRSVRSWLEAGLLHVVDERIALLNDPAPAEVAICIRYGFDVKRPSDFVEKKDWPGLENLEKHIMLRNTTTTSSESEESWRTPKLLLRTVKRNVFTIGAAFAAALVGATSRYVLFLEKDFAMDETLKQNHVIDELALSILMLKRGAAIVRLRSIKDQGCGSFRRCQNDANAPNFKGKSTFERRRNWWSFYCKSFSKPDSVADCAVGASGPIHNTKGLHFRCFTSWDSNWSLNAVLVDRLASLAKPWRLPPGSPSTRRSHFDGPGLSIAEYAAQTWNKQDGFEVGMLRDDWGKLRMPLCISNRGLFTHVEVDG